MRKFTVGFITIVVGSIALSTLWDSYTQKNHQLEKYQKEIINCNMEIEGLQDSILKLNGRLEIYDATWNYLRGIDSTTIDGLIHHIWKVYDFEEKYYYEVPDPVELIIS